MNRWLREFRLIPIVLVAIGCLFVLKAMGLLLDGTYSLGQRLGASGTMVVSTVPMLQTAQLRSPAVPMELPSKDQAAPRQSWMQDNYNYPDITGSVAASKPAPKDTPAKAPSADGPLGKNEPPVVQESPRTTPVSGNSVAMDQSRPPSQGERALLERLQERRQELDARARELEMREGLLKAAEKKLDVASSGERADDSRAVASPQSAPRKEEADANRLKPIVTMYESMKPKDAAKIFDRLDIRVLLELASQINPRKMSEILAQMNPEAAERLTVELASRGAPGDRTVNPANLPKIDGRPSGG